MDYLKNLNNAQRRAVLTTKGPVLVVAGAGAGKTRVITYRIMHLVKEGIDPSSILAITFTNKAAKEMSERVKLLGNDLTWGNMPFISTFHSLGVYILRSSGNKIGIPRHFSILDRSDSLSLLRSSIKSLGLDVKQFDPSRILSQVSKMKGDLITQEMFEADAGNLYFPSNLSKIWKSYELEMQKQKSVDFDDLLVKTVKLLEKHPEVRSEYQKRWQYIHIDEYQDTNEAQYRMSKILALPQKNIFVVGDADQNIYSWRGANIKNILHFEEDYPETTTILLEENYRSTQNILRAANTVIAKNKSRLEKNLYTKKHDGEKIQITQYLDETTEALGITQKAKEIIATGISPEDIAVLYRANFQSRILEEAFISAEVPYQVLGTRFFERKEIKDVVSFIRASLNQSNKTDIKRIINVPPRGIGTVTLLKIFKGEDDSLPEKTRQKVVLFKQLLGSIKEFGEKNNLSELIKYVIKETGIEAWLKNKTDDDIERLENIMELVTLAKKYDGFSGMEGIEKFLEEYSLATDADSLEKNEKAVKLMTVHASKGLEFKYVFIAGLEQDLFPHRNLNVSESDEIRLEEERRLFYVALTRAQEKLFLSYTALRTIFGSKQVNAPSEFLEDIDKEVLEREEPSLLDTIFID